MDCRRAKNGVSYLHATNTLVTTDQKIYQIECQNLRIASPFSPKCTVLCVMVLCVALHDRFLER